QALWAFLGLLAMGVLSRTDYQTYRRLAQPGLLLSVGLLVLVLLVGSEIAGARRWISLAGFNFQPSELAKLTLVNYLAAFAALRGGQMSHLWKGLIPGLMAAVVVAGLILLEPDFGTAAVVLGTAVIVLFVAGAQGKH